MQNIILPWAAKNGITITEAQLNMLSLHQTCVLDANQHMNLTAITNPAEFATKHIIDSLSVLPYVGDAKSLADVGTGAGFPGLVLAIMQPDLQITLIDSLRKRVFFLQETIAKLGLANVTAIHTRAEDLARQGKTFDICTARAVAQMDKLAKWVLPLTARGGRFIAMKGPNVSDELAKAKPSLTKLGGVLKTVDVVEITPEIRHSIVVVRRN